MSKEIEESVVALLTREGITYNAAFVPQSLSRNSAGKEHTLNWRVAFSRGKESMAFDYQQGIGHVPNYKQPRTLYDEQQLGEPWQSGKYNAGNKLYTPRTLPAPSPASVLHSIVMDNPHEETFERWASDLGYDEDSRKAEAIYRACVEQTRSAERVFGRNVLAELETLLQDY